jgi:23S rRNA (pseudouridine1915-N3)-methyltransferase
MKIKIIAVGKSMPHWVNEAYDDYSKRFNSKELQIELITIKAEKDSKNMPVEILKQKEGVRILDIIQSNEIIIALDEHGKSWNTMDLSTELQSWREESKTICLLIGGPNGLSDDCKKRARKTWSLSALTLPHPLVRVLLIEQLYRAWTLLIDHPYHRA